MLNTYYVADIVRSTLYKSHLIPQQLSELLSLVTNKETGAQWGEGTRTTGVAE